MKNLGIFLGLFCLFAGSLFAAKGDAVHIYMRPKGGGEYERSRGTIYPKWGSYRLYYGGRFFGLKLPEDLTQALDDIYHPDPDQFALVNRSGVLTGKSLGFIAWETARVLFPERTKEGDIVRRLRSTAYFFDTEVVHSESGPRLIIQRNYKELDLSGPQISFAAQTPFFGIRTTEGTVVAVKAFPGHGAIVWIAFVRDLAQVFNRGGAFRVFPVPKSLLLKAGAAEWDAWVQNKISGSFIGALEHLTAGQNEYPPSVVELPFGLPVHEDAIARAIVNTTRPRTENELPAYSEWAYSALDAKFVPRFPRRVTCADRVPQ